MAICGKAYKRVGHTGKMGHRSGRPLPQKEVLAASTRAAEDDLREVRGGLLRGGKGREKSPAK